MATYPLTFYPIFKEKIWGGQKIKTVLGKDFSPHANCGETWEISGYPGSESIVANGEYRGYSLDYMLGIWRASLVGRRIFEKHYYYFPLLVKFIDANEDLSVQVHPNDDLTRYRALSTFGKSEMWYIMDADEGARLTAGFSKKITPQEYLKLAEENRILEVLNSEKVYKDDIFYVPAGLIHNIGKGCLLAEIQQSSDVTYRIYDYDRTDADGNKRELHIKDALAAIDYNVYEKHKTEWQPKHNDAVEVVKSPHFTTRVLSGDQLIERDHTDLDSFVIYIGVEGNAQITGKFESVSVAKGRCSLMPASLKKFAVGSDEPFKVLEVFMS